MRAKYTAVSKVIRSTYLTKFDCLFHMKYHIFKTTYPLFKTKTKIIFFHFFSSSH